MVVRSVGATVVCAVTMLAGTVGSAAPAAAPVSAVPTPEVRGPVGDAGLRGHHFNTSVLPVEPAYVEEEFLFAGDARTFTRDDPATAPYVSRMVVRRPADPEAFNGTVFVEWVNVTAQQDLDQDWPVVHQMVMREGYAYVGVSAQAVGVRHLKAWDPVRYEDLVHPGDDFSFDVFAQAVQAVRSPSPDHPAPLGDLPVRTVIASGHSQSGMRLHTYVDRVQNRTEVIDGFFIRGQRNPQLDVEQLDTPVLMYMSDVEMTAREPSSSPWLRVWHVAGTAHASTWYAHWLADELAHDYGGAEPPLLFDDDRSGDYGQEPNPVAAPPGVLPPEACPNHNGPQMPDRYAISAALVHLDRWARQPGYGRRVPQPPLAQFDSTGALRRDEYGNVLGGLRLPPIDVPVATYTACGLAGGTVAFDAATLQRLYASRDEYVARMQAATDAAVEAGYMLPHDAADLMARARRAPVGRS